MAAKQFGEIGEKIIENMKAGTQLKRLGQPEEVAADGRVPLPPTTPPTSPANASASPAGMGMVG